MPCLWRRRGLGVSLLEPEARARSRNQNPFKAERIAEILRLIRIGPDTTDAQREQIRELISEFADCFALALSEVNAVPGYEHELNVPANAKLPLKPPSRSYNPAQRAYLEKSLDEMVEADIIQPIKPSEVQCVAPTVLAQKEHEGGGLALDELKHKLNDECIAHGMEPMPNMPPRPPPTNLENQPRPTTSQQKACSNSLWMTPDQLRMILMKEWLSYVLFSNETLTIP
ncbi:hypothetical protein H0H81_010959 [Sphagnurus paluster]|uniref:Uncharacterized protein n=1 Tax=Sphagnurus paluster TaxID=117069 RepID=A0A9P7GK93_9AGAR|nr:hypothetical protein H0H81_010959 [Sphagnurus paluster]